MAVVAAPTQRATDARPKHTRSTPAAYAVGPPGRAAIGSDGTTRSTFPATMAANVESVDGRRAA
jgi:hypothetical protein